METTLKKTNRLSCFCFAWKISPVSFAELIAWGIIKCIAAVANVWATRQILSLILSGYSREMVGKLLFYGFFILLSAAYSFYYERYRLQFQVVLEYERKVRAKLFEKSRRISNENFETAAAARMIRLADGAKGNLFRYAEIWIDIGMALLQAAAVTLYISTFNAWFVLLLPFSTIPPCLTLIYQSNLWKKYYEAIEQCKREESEYLKGLIDEVACKESRITYAADVLSEKWSKSRGQRDQMEDQKSRKLLLLKLALTPCDLIGSYGGYLVSVLLLFFGKIDYAGCTAAIAAYASLVSAFSSLTSTIGYEGQFRKMIQPFFNYWNLPERAADGEAGSQKGGAGKHASEMTCFGEASKAAHEIRLEHVSFSYPGQDTKAPDDISLTIRSGEVLAVVGENGAGKTTLSNVILGNFLPGSGTVFYDGKDIAALPESTLHREQSIVPQSFNRYKMTVEDNIAIGDFEKEKREEIVRKKELFLSDPEIQLDTLLGKEFGGRELSGGQWQQLSCARGFYKTSSFLVLDEATSAIDPLKEKAMYDAFAWELKGKTGVIITHRLGAVSLADRIIVLEHGRIVQEGTHSELLHEDGPYLKLWNTQTRAFGEGG